MAEAGVPRPEKAPQTQGGRHLEEPLLGTLKRSFFSRVPLGTRIPWPSVPVPELPTILRRSTASLKSSSSTSSEGRACSPTISHSASVSQWLRQCTRRENKSKVSKMPRLISSVVRESFYDRRAQLLTGDRHNLDILTPYAQLQLCVQEAQNLVAPDANSLLDPYVEVYVNDVCKGRSRHLPRTLDPKWDFRIALDIWSPFSIVRLVVMDHDRFSKHELVGFVELRVAEVLPNGPWLHGWCELRLPGMMEGTATHRFRHHRSLRDDRDLSSPCTSPRHHDARLEKTSSLGSRSSSEGVRTPSKLSGERRARVKRNTVKAPTRPLPAQQFLNAGKRAKGLLRVVTRDAINQRLNAGEVHISVQLETLAGQTDSRGAKAEQPEQLDLGWILLSALFYPSWLLDVCCEEWYACCFPRPEFESAGGQDDREPFSLQDVKEFYDTASQVKSAFLGCIGWPTVSIFCYIVSWHDILLSSATMAYWLLFCVFPWRLLPTLPLGAMFWLNLLRNPEKCNTILAHEATAPLTEEGLSLMAALRSTKRMSLWLRRLVKDRGGWVKKMAALQDYARLTHKDGHPTLSFDLLVTDLMAQSWVNRKVSREKHCREGHVLQFIGVGTYLPDDGWVCSGPVGQQCSDCQAGIVKYRLHLGTKRYHCGKCQMDFCGLCAAGGRVPAMVMRVDATKLPMGGSAMVRTVRDFVLENQDILDDVQELLEGFLKILERLRSPQEQVLAFRVYIGLAASSVLTLVVLVVVNSRIGFLLAWAWTLFCIAVGSACMVQGAMPIRRARTAYRATRNFAKCRELRQRGGCSRWRFFTEDADPSVPELLFRE